MKRSNLSFHLSCAPTHALRPAEPVFCTVFETETTTVLFLEAPNWANAVPWGPAMALQSWVRHSHDPTRLNAWNPADLEHFFMYRLRPGYPEGGLPLWDEPFTYYQGAQRASTLVQRLYPVSGTGLVKEGTPLGLSSVFKTHALEPQPLQRFDAAGLLLPPNKR